jgi:predicted nucleic acid-binding protein
MYLVDTDVFSMTNSSSKFTGDAVEAWRSWPSATRTDYISASSRSWRSISELKNVRTRARQKKAEGLRRWLIAAETIHRDRILPVTIEIARTAGAMLHEAVKASYAPSSEDAVIAATARVEGFRILSRNGKDMKALGADWLDPLATTPPDILG